MNWWGIRLGDPGGLNGSWIQVAKSVPLKCLSLDMQLLLCIGNNNGTNWKKIPIFLICGDTSSDNSVVKHKHIGIAVVAGLCERSEWQHSRGGLVGAARNWTRRRRGLWVSKTRVDSKKRSWHCVSESERMEEFDCEVSFQVWGQFIFDRCPWPKMKSKSIRQLNNTLWIIITVKSYQNLPAKSQFSKKITPNHTK